jgi:thioesterase domain-containing protein
VQLDCELVPLRRLGQRIPLFCVHAGGGDASGYRDLTAAMHDDQPVYGFSPPTNLRESNLFPSVEDLASNYLDRMRNVQPQGPYQICGQSFGGLVAYEMANLLLKEDDQVYLVALFDTPHPEVGKRFQVTGLLDFNLKYLEYRVRKYFCNLLRGRVDNIISDGLRFARSRITRLSWLATRTAARTLNRPMPLIINTNALLFDAAFRVYRPRRFQGPLVLFRSATRTPEYDDDSSLGWKTCAPNVRVHIVPGDHVTMMKVPHINVLVEKLTPYLAGSMA